ncbi:YqjD family protein [Collimonas sp.]|jgi:ElaB/YqjD/DUF883 family membrane-anchored ribosome-binding protein|uniref:YqjD family protein n=1 Tax=Collimonas sp. TaxID=1963772 RepID=UPI0037C0D865
MTTTDNVKEMRDNLAGELKSVIKEVETLLDDTQDQAEKKYNSVRAKLRAALDTAKTELPKATKKAVEHTKHAAHVTDDYVGDNPWKAVGIAAAIGLLAGLVIGRSK